MFNDKLCVIPFVKEILLLKTHVNMPTVTVDVAP